MAVITLSRSEMNKYPIYPSLLAFDFARLGEQTAQVEAGGAAGLHFDVMDNHFVPNLTFGAMIAAALRKKTSIPIHAHLMTYHPETLVQPFHDAGVNLIFVHPESTPHIHRLLGQIKSLGMQAGIAINPGTPVSIIEPVADMLDAVLIMSVNPGFGGQSFIPATYHRLRKLCQMMNTLKLNPMILCDGGVNIDTIKPLSEAGMSAAVVGSALFVNGDPGGEIVRLQNAAR